EHFSTVTITNRQCELGGQIPARVDILRRQHWLAASQLLTADPNSPLRDTRGGAAIFYAESWAVVDMLTSSPDYAPHFRDLMGILNSENISSQQALATAYNKSPDLVLADAQNWTSHARSARRTLPSLAPETVRMELNQVSQSEARAIVADLLFANGEWDRAEQIYQDLLHASPDNPEILASLGTVALRKANRQGAIEYWRKALDHGLTDAVLCYRYALLADEMELPPKEIERALQQAVTIRQDFDDARYKLALLESNAGEYDAAVNQLQSMSAPRPERAYGYWTALANALSELGKRNEADAAAKQALRFAKTSDERARAAELSWVANTDLAVRFAKSADGKPQLVTTRVPHGAADFNPFVEADDHIQVATGRLREVQCSEGKLTGFLVESKAGILSLAVPDPLHVLMRNGPSQFTCGPQTTGNVTVEYAASAKSNTGGLLRGMDFRVQ
ncbi:MAG: hypothetical protein JWP08_1052, partial [Bryobacterales bacterium]|nr:hypothetical protein [Bryobacterales bacterium]